MKFHSSIISMQLRWRHNTYDGVSNHQSHDCLRNRLIRSRSKKTWRLRVTGLCVGNSSVTGEFLAQKASHAKNVSIWWRHHNPFLLAAFRDLCRCSGGFGYWTQNYCWVPPTTRVPQSLPRKVSSNVKMKWIKGSNEIRITGKNKKIEKL